MESIQRCFYTLLQKKGQKGRFATTWDPERFAEMWICIRTQCCQVCVKHSLYLTGPLFEYSEPALIFGDAPYLSRPGTDKITSLFKHPGGKVHLAGLSDQETLKNA